jgi:putative transposase
LDAIKGIGDLNSRLWAWIEQVYHRRPHEGLDGQTPHARWRQDLDHIHHFRSEMTPFDDLFLHRIERYVRKDASLSWQGQWYEVPHPYAGQTVYLVFDPHLKQALRIESANFENLGPVTLLDKLANTHRRRQRPTTIDPTEPAKRSLDAVEMAYQQYNNQLIINNWEDN